MTYLEQIAEAIYMSHWYPGDPAAGRNAAPQWPQSSKNVQSWVTDQARASIIKLREIYADNPAVVAACNEVLAPPAEPAPPESL